MEGIKRLALASNILLMTVVTPTFAAMSAPSGWYLEGAAGSTYVTGKSYPGNPSHSGARGGFTAGYKFMRYFATEAGYTLYYNTNITDPTSGTNAAFDRHYSYDVALKGIYPILCTGFELFGKLGIAQVKSSMGIENTTGAANLGLSGNSHTATGSYLGAGVQYYFSPFMAMNLQYARAQGDSETGNPSLLSIGLSLLFG